MFDRTEPSGNPVPRLCILGGLLVCLVSGGLAACTLQHGVTFRPGFQIPASGTSPIPLRAGVVMPEISAMPPVVVSTSCAFGETVVTVPYDQEFSRLAYQMASQTFQSVDLVSDKVKAAGHYDVLVEFNPPKVVPDSICLIQVIAFWQIWPLFYPPEQWTYQLEVSARLTDGSGQGVIGEAAYTGTARSDYSLQETFAGVIRNVLISMTNAPKFIQYAQAIRRSPAVQAVTAETPALRSGQISVSPPAGLAGDVERVPSLAVKPKPHAYAVVIGIEQYRERLPKADFADRDAILMGEYLTKVFGYPEENVVVRVNDKAARTDMEKYFEAWLPNNVEKDSSVFIYYSGHGTPNTKSGDAFLVPYDGDPTFIEKTGYPLKRLYAALDKLPAKDITVVLDSCFSGAGGRSVLAKGAKPMVLSVENLMVAGGKTVVLAASSGDQTSSAYSEKGHGLLTYFFLKGLQGAGDLNKDGSIEMAELFEYVRPQVQRVARKQLNNEQTPQLLASPDLLRKGAGRLVERAQ